MNFSFYFGHIAACLSFEQNQSHSGSQIAGNDNAADPEKGKLERGAFALAVELYRLVNKNSSYSKLINSFKAV